MDAFDLARLIDHDAQQFAGTVLRTSGAARPHHYGRRRLAKPAGYEFTERMLH